MKKKVFLIFILTIGLTAYLVSRISIPDKSGNDGEGTDVVQVVKDKIQKNNTESEKNKNEQIDKDETTEKKKKEEEKKGRREVSDKDQVFFRNIFQRKHEVTIVEKTDTSEVSVEEQFSLSDLITDIKNRLDLSFIFLSGKSEIALINRRKYRVGDKIPGNDLETVIKGINQDYVTLRIGTTEVRLSINKGE